MLDGLKTNLQAAIKKLVSSSGVDEDLIKQLQQILQLLQMKNHNQVAIAYTDGFLPQIGPIGVRSEVHAEKIKDRAINEKPPPGLHKSYC